MTQLEFDDTTLTIKVQGADKFWALKSELKVPLEHVVEANYDPEVARGWYHGLKLPGSNIPGVLTAGTFYRQGQKVFWDVHHPDKTIIITLKDEQYNQLVIEIEDPHSGIDRIKSAIA